MAKDVASVRHRAARSLLHRVLLEFRLCRCQACMNEIQRGVGVTRKIQSFLRKAASATANICRPVAQQTCSPCHSMAGPVLMMHGQRLTHDTFSQVLGSHARSWKANKEPAWMGELKHLIRSKLEERNGLDLKSTPASIQPNRLAGQSRRASPAWKPRCN